MYHYVSRRICELPYADDTVLLTIMSIIGTTLFPYLMFREHFNNALIYLRDLAREREESKLWAVSFVWFGGFLYWIYVGLYRGGFS